MFKGDWNDLYHSNHVAVVPLGTVEQTAKKVYASSREVDSYGDTIEGEVFIIFEVEGKTYRVNGYMDSYGTATWDGVPFEAKPITKTITVWE